MFDDASVAVAAIREQDVYGGRRVTLEARLGTARLRLQVDVGIGDAVTPDPQWLDYPTILDLPAPRLRAYPPESVAAEKLHATVLLGTANTRMKDDFDLFTLVRGGALDAERLAEAIGATFERRRTTILGRIPVGLSDAYAQDPSRAAMWRAFLGRSGLEAPGLSAVVRELRSSFATAIAGAARRARES